MKEKIYVNFVIKTDEAIRLECSNGVNRAEKEIFIVDENFYFFYMLNRNKDTQTVSLREITKEEYYARKAEILNCQPDKTIREWNNNGNHYVLRIFRFGTWKRNLLSSDCIFISENNRVKDLADSVVAEVTAKRDAETMLDKQSKLDYAHKCGGLSQKLGIDFVNVLRIGPEKGKLAQFQESYQKALVTTQTLPLSEQRRFYDLLNGGRKTRKTALDQLGIKYFDADVNLMSFKDLIQNLWKNLSDYSEESVKEAIKIAIDLCYEQRMRIYEKLGHSSREVRREALKELHVDVKLIEFRRYPIQRIRREIAATLGIELD